MLPKPPPRESSLGFLFLPPFRVQGLSMAGEITCVQVPELDVCFDMGSCPRAMLASKYVPVSHGHMDHIGALAYYCSQRRFQGMGTGNIVCDKRIEKAVRGMMTGFIELERQETEYNLITLEPEQSIQIKNQIFLKGFLTDHTCPSMGYVVYEKRSKLKGEYEGLPQDKLKELKDRGITITRTLEIPLVAYLGDTAPGPHLIREDVRTSQVIISECTFFEPDHKDRAKIGKHLHVDDIAEWVRLTTCKAMVLIHLSRRTEMQYAREELARRLSPADQERVHMLMDHRTNRARYERQLAEAGEAAPTHSPAAPNTPANPQA
jgi:ribonuclease Z